MFCIRGSNISTKSLCNIVIGYVVMRGRLFIVLGLVTCHLLSFSSFLGNPFVSAPARAGGHGFELRQGDARVESARSSRRKIKSRGLRFGSRPPFGRSYNGRPRVFELITVACSYNSHAAVVPADALDSIDPRQDAGSLKGLQRCRNAATGAAGGLGDPLIAREAKAATGVVEGPYELVEHVEALGRDTVPVGFPRRSVAR
jgi:hypothetical protein